MCQVIYYSLSRAKEVNKEMLDKKLVAERLIRFRKEKKETQQVVAKACGITRSSYASYEQGERTPSDATKVKLANHFNVTVLELFF